MTPQPPTPPPEPPQVTPTPTPTSPPPTTTETRRTTETASYASKLLGGGPLPGDIDAPGPATPCTLTLLPRTRRKSACVLLPTGRAPLDNVLEVLTMSGIVGSHLAAELEVPPVALSRLRHDCIGDDGFIIRDKSASGEANDALIWGLAGIAAAGPPVNGILNGITEVTPKIVEKPGEAIQAWRRQWALWCYMTGAAREADWQGDWERSRADVASVSVALAEYLTTYKPPLVLVRFLSGLPSGDFAQSLGLSRQRLNLIEGRDPTENALTANYLRTAVALHLKHLSIDSFWGAHGCRILPTETP